MVKRSRAEWLALFEAQKNSGLSHRQFCREHDLCPKYFGLRKKQLLAGPPLSGFVAVKPEPAASVAASNVITLRYRDIELELRAPDAAFVASLIRRLV